MASGTWQINNAPGAATKATATQTAPTTGEKVNIRLRALQASVANVGTAGLVTLQVTDGTSNLFQASMNGPAPGTAVIALADLDIRSTTGTLTVQFSGAPSGHLGQQSVNAQGDLVPAGHLYGDSYS